jgi:FkbM family methyltransferase
MAKIKLAIDLSPIDRLRARPDFQQNATRALARRLYYRMRWAATEKPWRLKLGEDLEVMAPKGGAGALIYYLGYSEPETAAFVRRFLKPGMVFWDIGAHIGEYSLLAARQVGPSGKVEAIEPQPAIRGYLKSNVELNGFQNIRVHNYAASSQRGEATLQLTEEPSMAHLTNGSRAPNRGAGSRPASQEIRVPTISLDAFLAFTGKIPHLVKVDVEGAEKLVLKGADSLLSIEDETAPVWVMEYSPRNCSANGYPAASLLETFCAKGYMIYSLQPDGGLEPLSSPVLNRKSENFVASKVDLVGRQKAAPLADSVIERSLTAPFTGS